jgi:D-glycero-D-manno-heptose 1,7-bisphosphate phosphatase
VSGPSRSAVFVDRDGVINRLVADAGSGPPESPYRVEDVALLPGAGAALTELAEAGFAVVVASNQPAVAKGIATRADLDAVHARVVELLGDEAGAVLDWRYCRHHPDAIVPELRGCACRKPKPGLLLDAARDHDLDLRSSWMVGDADRDIAAGVAAGCRTVLIEHPDSGHRRDGLEADLHARDLPDATGAILGAPGYPSRSK